MSQFKSIAVIGSGAAGLCAAKHLFHYGKGIPLKPVVFEQRDVLGGQWFYEDVDKDNCKEVYSSMYQNLRTNLPKQVMMYPDFPYSEHLPTYMHHTDVLKYLNDYADHFRLTELIRFNTEVISVSPVLKDGLAINDKSRFVKWNVVSKNKKTQETTAEVYDAVVVCNGRYAVPAYTTIEGLKYFKGEMLHSHYYRRASEFSGKDVLILGSGPSAIDIMSELVEHCRMVYLSHRGARLTSKLPENVAELPNISHVNETGDFVMEDATTHRVDVFLPCTGYQLHYSFFSSETNVVVEDNSLKMLYKHMFHLRYPSLIFVGLTWKNTPFPAFHQQSAYLTSVLAEQKWLPSYEDMCKDTESEISQRLESGELPKYFHRMGDRQFTYNEELADLAGNTRNPRLIENLYRYAFENRKKDACNYKKIQYKIISENEFEEKI